MAGVIQSKVYGNTVRSKRQEVCNSNASGEWDSKLPFFVYF